MGLLVLTYAFCLLSFWGVAWENEHQVKGKGLWEDLRGVGEQNMIKIDGMKKIKTHKTPCVLETLIQGLQAMVSPTLQVLEFNPGRKR